MEQRLANYPNVSIKLKHRVTAVIYDPQPGELKSLEVLGTKHSDQSTGNFNERYSHVLFTIPPPCLRPIDLSTCQLDLLQRDAIRQVSSGPSSKIGMRFKSAWWSDASNNFNIHGGQSSTDRMVRTVVYPSYGDGRSKTLIVSYVWSE